MTPNPNPSPELLPCPFCGNRPSVETEKRCHAIMCLNPDCGEVMTRWLMSADDAAIAWNTRALSPQTLPAPGEVPNRWYAEAPAHIWLHGIGDPIGETTWATDPMPGGEDVEQEHAVGYIRDDLATVAAANDEAFACGVEAAAKVVDAEYNLRKAHHTANKEAGNKKETRDFETMMIAHTQSAAAIRLLSPQVPS